MTRRMPAVVGVILVLLMAGCAGITPDAGPSPPDSGPGGTADGGSATPAGDTVQVDIMRIVDGDTVEIAYENGTADTVRLIGVDTPEVHVENDPSKFEGIPDTESGRTCLDRWGERASTFAKERLADHTVTLRYDPNLDRRGYYNRLLAYVVIDGKPVNFRLVERGYARVYESDFTERERYEDAQARAKEENRGLWACTDDTDATPTAGTSSTETVDGSLSIVRINADAAGNDNDNLNDEYVVFENQDDESLDLSGWTVRDEAGHEYTVPDGFTLVPGEQVTLHTGEGSDTETDLYWGQTGAVWNNGGDTVTVVDADGAVVARRSYSG